MEQLNHTVSEPKPAHLAYTALLSVLVRVLIGTGIGIGYTIRPLAINKSPHGIDGSQTKASPSQLQFRTIGTL